MSKIFVGIDVSKKELAVTMIINDKSHYDSFTNNKELREKVVKL